MVERRWAHGRRDPRASGVMGETCAVEHQGGAMKTMLSVALIVGAVLAVAAPALAEHNSEAAARDSVDLNLDVKIGGGGFFVGGGVFGVVGGEGARVDGGVRPPGRFVHMRVPRFERAAS